MFHVITTVFSNNEAPGPPCNRKMVFSRFQQQGMNPVPEQPGKAPESAFHVNGHAELSGNIQGLQAIPVQAPQNDQTAGRLKSFLKMHKLPHGA